MRSRGLEVTLKWLSKARLGVLAGGLMLSACGFHSDVAALERLRAAIRTRIGTDSAITVRTDEGRTTVNVRLYELPARDSIQVQAEVEALAKAEFPNTSYVVVSRL